MQLVLQHLLQNQLQRDVARFTTLIKSVLHQIRLLKGLKVGGKTCNIVFNSFCSNVAKQVACFLWPIFPYLKKILIQISLLPWIILHRGHTSKAFFTYHEGKTRANISKAYCECNFFLISQNKELLDAFEKPLHPT